jgi:integrase
MAVFSGLRKSEIQGLREIHVKRTAWRTTTIEQGTKTEASQGAVPVLPLLARHLEAHRKGFAGDGFIFEGPKLGRPVDLHNPNRVIRPGLKKANIPCCVSAEDSQQTFTRSMCMTWTSNESCATVKWP